SSFAVVQLRLEHLQLRVVEVLSVPLAGELQQARWRARRGAGIGMRRGHSCVERALGGREAFARAEEAEGPRRRATRGGNEETSSGFHENTLRPILLSTPLGQSAIEAWQGEIDDHTTANECGGDRARGR